MEFDQMNDSFKEHVLTSLAEKGSINLDLAIREAINIDMDKAFKIIGDDFKEVITCKVIVKFDEWKEAKANIKFDVDLTIEDYDEKKLLEIKKYLKNFTDYLTTKGYVFDGEEFLNDIDILIKMKSKNLI